MIYSRLCGRCGSYKTVDCVSSTKIHPRGCDTEIVYKVEFTLCDICGEETIRSDQISRNEERKHQAMKEATIAYKMKKWLNNK